MRHRLILTALMATTAIGAAALAADYTVVMSKGPAGTMSVTATPDGSRHVTYEFNDRGRGPVTTTDTIVDARGLTTRLSVKGIDYFKTPVDERFQLTGHEAVWSSAADEGKDPSGDGKAYVANQGSSEDLAILARALLKAPRHELDLIPGGHARIEKAGERQVKGVDGPETVTLYLISGAGFQPAPIWLDAKGELFNEGGAWIHAVRKGAEDAAPELIKIQDRALADQLAADAKRLQRRPAGPVVFVHARLFDSESARMIPGSTVVVRGGKVETVGADGAVAIPAGAEVIDAKGRTLMPGLVDMHVHIASDPDGLLDILSGVTTVRDLGGDMDELLARKKRFETGEQIGPRIWLAGLIDGKGPFAGPIKTLVSTPEEARADVDLYADHGYQQIKIYSSVKPELVPGMIARAHERGLRVSGHIPAGVTMSQAVDEGYDEVQHANFWFLNFMSPEVNARSNTMARFVEVGAHAKDLDLNSAPVNAFVAQLKAHHTVVDPTLVAFEDMYLGGPHKPAPSLAAVMNRLPPAVARGSTGGGLGKTDEDRKAYAASFEQMLRMTRKLHDAGVTIVAGTDGLAGLPLAHELENYVRAGIPAPQVLQIATLGAARVMRHDAEQGTIAPGKSADLILVDGDPSTNISDIRRISFVMKGGVVYDVPAIARSIGMKAE
jgi:hypothetical protein